MSQRPVVVLYVPPVGMPVGHELHVFEAEKNDVPVPQVEHAPVLGFRKPLEQVVSHPQ